MKQSQRRYFSHSGCDCQDCTKTGFKEFGYAILVLILLILSFGSLFVIAEAVFPSTQIVK
jgi:hypothetical protein